MNNIKNIDEFLEKYVVMKKLYDNAQDILETTKKVENQMYIECIYKTQELIRYLDEQNPFVINRHKEQVKNTYYISAELLVRTVGLISNRPVFSDSDKNSMHIAIIHLRKVLGIDPMNNKAKELFKMSFLYLTLFNSNPKENIDCLNQILSVDPCDYQLHYNLGFSFHRANQLDNSLYHYKLSIGILELLLENEKLKHGKETDNTNAYLQFKVKCLNGIGGVYFSIQDRETALYYFELAYEINPLDPDINNQIGVIYTELRITDKAIKYYEKGIENYQLAHISTDKDMLIASMYMNMGLVKCYECDFTGAIDGYNKALKYKPRLSLAYQNKLLDVNYISHLIEDPMYISKLHKNINKIYPNVIQDYKIGCPNYTIKQDLLKLDKPELLKKGAKINIGFVSGDFICHPVSYFIHSVFKHINYDLFNVFCYSVKIVNLNSLFEKCNWKVIKNNSDVEVKKLIQEDSIDILIDLSAHTGDNRLDVFVLKPAPIQISYCGYPNSSGIKSMDYRIVDRFCDSNKSQKYYQEEFIFMERCFLAYSPSMGIKDIPQIVKSPYQENGFITFGCFNRYNKINKMVIQVWEKILIKAPTARFVIKTKEFSTDKLKQQFFDTFTDKTVLERVTVLPYSDTYQDHLPDYNKMDISLDTFPYCGTTTSCESLCMGVPVLTLFDNIRYYHSQNVTTSLLKNSNLSEFVAYSQDEYIDKAVSFATNINKSFDLKNHVRNSFVNGYVCNYSEFIDDFENKLLLAYKNHKW